MAFPGEYAEGANTRPWEMGPNPVPNRGVISRVRIVNSDEKFHYRVSLLFYEPLDVDNITVRIEGTGRNTCAKRPSVPVETFNKVAPNEITFDVKKRDLYSGDLFQFCGTPFFDSPYFPLKDIIATIDECGIFDTTCICGPSVKA